MMMLLLSTVDPGGAKSHKAASTNLGQYLAAAMWGGSTLNLGISFYCSFQRFPEAI